MSRSNKPSNIRKTPAQLTENSSAFGKRLNALRKAVNTAPTPSEAEEPETPPDEGRASMVTRFSNFTTAPLSFRNGGKEREDGPHLPPPPLSQPPPTGDDEDDNGGSNKTDF